MVHGRAAVAVVHRLVAGGPVRLELAAVCTWRDAHGERRRRRPAPPVRAGGRRRWWSRSAYRLAGPGWAPAGQWWLGRAPPGGGRPRACTADEDLWYAGPLRRRAGAPRRHRRRCGPGPATWPSRAAAGRREVVAAARRAQPGGGRRGDARPTTVQATPGAGRRRVRRAAPPHGPDVVAGYPWFGAWSRDTMIATRACSSPPAAPTRGASCCGRTRRRCPRGCSPTPPTPAGWSTTPSTRTLWFLHAVEPARRRHRRRRPRPPSCCPRCATVVDAHLAGTRYGIGVDPADGLLTQGAAGRGADLDGRPGRRGAGHPADRQAGRGQRALDQRAGRGSPS